MFEEINHKKSIFDDNQIQGLIEYAKQFNIPIIQDQGLVFLVQLIKLHKPSRILEIGTAIGYSSIQMARFSNASIDTIERNPEMIRLAKANIELFGLSKRIHVLEADALELDVNQLAKTYDLIFIDAAKAQYQKFFEKYAPLLSESGVIISDNLSFHGLVYGTQTQSKNLNGLIRKIEQYIDYLKQHPNFDSLFFEIGDGMAVSERKK